MGKFYRLLRPEKNTNGIKEMNYIVLLQILAFFGYVAYVWYRIGIQKSISDSWYQLPDKKDLFVAFTAGVGLPMWAYSVCGFSDSAQFLFALSGFFMFCIGIASTFKANKMTKYIHYYSTLTAILFAFAGIYAESSDYITLIITFVGVLALTRVKNKIWWIEIFVFAMLISKIMFL